MIPALTSVELPKINLPNMDFNSLPKLDLPKIDMNSLPKINIPQMDLNSLAKVPDISRANLPSIDFAGVDESLLPVIGLAGALVVAAAVLNSNTSGTVKKATRTSPLAIPYDAAARLAYQEWLTENEETYSDEGYLVFKELYEARTVAMVTSKKLARDLESFQNKKVAPKPRRTLSVPKKKTVDNPFFFAEEAGKKGK